MTRTIETSQGGLLMEARYHYLTDDFQLYVYGDPTFTLLSASVDHSPLPLTRPMAEQIFVIWNRIDDALVRAEVLDRLKELVSDDEFMAQVEKEGLEAGLPKVEAKVVRLTKELSQMEGKLCLGKDKLRVLGVLLSPPETLSSEFMP